MSEIVHVANTNVELELAQSSIQPLELSWSRHPACLQLQFLPLLYAAPNDLVAVTAMPDMHYLESLKREGFFQERLPKLVFLSEKEILRGKTCDAWGPSRQIEAWAKNCGVHYALPDWDVVKLINSKAFSFRYSVLPQAALIENEESLCKWLQSFAGPKVLKACYGFAGRGNRHIMDEVMSPEILVFCKKEWMQKRPIVAEPWLNRICDFSTQWFIHQGGDINYLGATRFETDSYGTYTGTIAGPEDLLFSSLQLHLIEHKKVARKVAEEIAELNFFGAVGFDALLYKKKENSKVCLYPLIEINGRKTMSWVALKLQQNFYPKTLMRFNFENSDSSENCLLPSHLIDRSGKMHQFSKNLILKKDSFHHRINF